MDKIELDNIEKEILSRKKNIETIKKEYNLSEGKWNSIAHKIYRKHLKLKPPDIYKIHAEINDKLSLQHILCCPPYCTRPELDQINNLLTLGRSAELWNLFKRIILDPDIRAKQQKGRFEGLPIFKNFSPNIHAASSAMYNGNIIASFFTLVPIIEGVLLRWQGFPGTLSKYPDFDKTKKFIKNSLLRNPLPNLLKIFDSWVETVDFIFKNHFYFNTDDPAFDSKKMTFNRHLALHFLDDVNCATLDNLTRLFLLLDLLTEIYICEKNIPIGLDPRFTLTYLDTLPYKQQYETAVINSNFTLDLT